MEWGTAADEAAAENDQLTYTTIVIDEGTITGLDSATGRFTTKNGDVIAFGGGGGEPTFVELLAQTRTGDFTVNSANLTGSIKILHLLILKLFSSALYVSCEEP